MDILKIYEVQLEKVREKFSDVVDSSIILRSESGEPLKLRLDMIDGSIVDVFYSVGGKFMVQLEVKYEGDWKGVVRYDCAHGYAHRDSYNLRGKHKKDELYLSFEDALTLADDDIDDNWETYKHRFLEADLT